MRKAPLLTVALAMMCGIMLSHHTDAFTPSLWLWSMAATAVLLGITLIVDREPSMRIAAWLAVAFCGMTGGLLTSTTDPRHDPRHWTRDCPQQTYLAVRLCETPTPRAKSYKADAEVLSLDGIYRRGKIRLYLRHDSTAATLHYGDSLLLHCFPDSTKGTVYVTSDHYLLTGRDSTSLRALSEALRMNLVKRMHSGPLSTAEAGIATALTLGWRADIPPSTYASFRDAGIAHLLAVSGLHVGLLAAMVGWMMLWTGRERHGRIARGSVQLLAVCSFTLLSGMAPSTVRAALMFSLFIVENITQRRTPRLNLLATAAIITLCLDPSLLFNLGWQLSYAAVAGIVLAQPLIQAFRSRLWQASAVSMAATMATTPITMHAFHCLHPYFLIANVVVVPLAGMILFLSIMYLLMPCVVTAWPLHHLLDFAVGVSSWVATLPYAVVELTP